MSEKKILQLRTQLYQLNQDADQNKYQDCLDGLSGSSIINIDPSTMQVADWDQVLSAILDHDQCLVL